jgi:transposase
MNTGRPTKYDPEMCEKAVEFLSEGLSIQAMAGEMGVCKDTIYEWMKVHPEFSDAIKRGVAKGALFWEKIGRAGASGKIKGFNPAAWIFTMKNRFKWTDRVEVSGTEDAETKPLVLAYKK